MFTRGLALWTLVDRRAALDDLDAVVDCALKRLPRTPIAGALVAVAPPGMGRACLAVRSEPDGADTP